MAAQQNRLVWKCSLHCFRHTHGVSFIKRSVDFFLKVYVGTKARFCLRTSFRIYKYAGTCAKNSFIDPSQGKIMHACISSSPYVSGIPQGHSHRPHTFTRSPAACNRHSVIYTLHSDAQRPVYRSATWTSLTLSILQYSCDSHSPQLQHDPDPPAKNPTSVITDKNQRTAICVSAYLVSLSALCFNDKPVIKTNLYSLTSCLRPVLWQKTGPYNIHLHGSPAPNTCRCPWGTRQHPPDFTHSHLSSCCLWKSHGLACFLRMWCSWVGQLPVTSGSLHRNATPKVPHRAF